MSIYVEMYLFDMAVRQRGVVLHQRRDLHVEAHDLKHHVEAHDLKHLKDRKLHGVVRPPHPLARRARNLLSRWKGS